MEKYGAEIKDLDRKEKTKMTVRSCMEPCTLPLFLYCGAVGKPRVTAAHPSQKRRVSIVLDIGNLQDT
jgi:hypothetical protein